MRTFIGFFLILLPFVVTSCSNEKQLKTKTDLKEVIKANNAYADINWVDIKDLDKLMAKRT